MLDKVPLALPGAVLEEFGKQRSQPAFVSHVQLLELMELGVVRENLLVGWFEVQGIHR